MYLCRKGWKMEEWGKACEANCLRGPSKEIIHTKVGNCHNKTHLRRALQIGNCFTHISARGLDEGVFAIGRQLRPSAAATCRSRPSIASRASGLKRNLAQREASGSSSTNIVANETKSGYVGIASMVRRSAA